MPLQDVTSAKQLDELVATHPEALFVLDFWASWCDPCKQMNDVVEQLSKTHTAVYFIKIEAEEVDELADRYHVRAVPAFSFCRAGKALDSLSGANAPALARLVERFAKEPAVGIPVAVAVSSSTAAPSKASIAVGSGRSGQSLEAYLRQLVNQAPVMLFMKGSPTAPQCGFSNKIVNILRENGIRFSSFDILSDEEVRQGLKEFSKWPTYPQLYVEGKLIGGLDIIKELVEEGELLSMIPAAARA